MNEEQKKEGIIEGEAIVVNTETSENSADAMEDKTFEQSEAEKTQADKIKNLTAAVILLLGVAVGSLFVDIIQFASGSGYSEKALKNAEIFEGGGKTWVAFSDPPVQISVLAVDEETQKNCPKCDPADVLTWIRRFIPTVVAKRIDANSPEGKKLIEQYNLKTIPSFVFDNNIKNSNFYNGEARQLFEEKNDHFVLNATQLGVPVGKYLETPPIKEEDATLGSKDAKVKIVVFSDFQCPYCKAFWTTVVKVSKEYGDKVQLAYKEFPLDFHPQANNASLAATCAQDQGKFWEMGDLLYNSQQEWGKTQGKDVFKTYAKKLGLDAKKFNECIDVETFNNKIKSDMAQAGEFGISGTPSGFVGEQFVGGVVKEEDLKKMIDEELQK